MPTLTEAMSLIVAWQKVAEWIVSHRVRITTVVFSLLIVVDILTGIKPHNPTNIDNIASLAGMTFIVVGLWARSWAAGTLHKLTRLTTHGPYRRSLEHLDRVGAFPSFVRSSNTRRRKTTCRSIRRPVV